ncbi:hypothetical protein JTB14_014479 [Gonioctena quinquepunctata]|nr:hypothetical protein JTB14_014479 [Gonioctena quinquepunctata]
MNQGNTFRKLRPPNKCGNCGGPHKSNYRGCSKFPITEKKERPPLPRHTRPIRNTRKEETPEMSENSTLKELLAAMDELRDLLIRRPILAGMIQLKNCRGAETPPSSD